MEVSFYNKGGGSMHKSGNNLQISQLSVLGGLKEF